MIDPTLRWQNGEKPPMDELVSESPGTRFGPRVIRLRVVDFGDAPVVPADPVAPHAAILRTVAEAVAALVGDRIVREILTGIALRRRGETATA
jgi:hypothetical protein